MEKNSNDLLMLGVFILVVGILLATYSLTTYIDIKNLQNKIDFEMVDNNNSLSSTDKYYKYLSYADFLNQKLTKNKDILIKNSSCIYLDYAQHNAIELYKLTDRQMVSEDSKKTVAAGNLRSLSTMLDNYTTCKKAAEYKSELDNMLLNIQKEEAFSAERELKMRNLMQGYEQEQLIEENAPELQEIPAGEREIKEIQAQTRTEEKPITTEENQ